jgi:hypothetical protein
MRQPMIFSVWHMNRKIFYVACDSESVRSKAQLSFDSSPRRKICSQLLNLYNPNVWTPRILMFLWHKLDDVYWILRAYLGASVMDGIEWIKISYYSRILVLSIPSVTLGPKWAIKAISGCNELKWTGED